VAAAAATSTTSSVEPMRTAACRRLLAVHAGTTARGDSDVVRLSFRD